MTEKQYYLEIFDSNKRDFILTLFFLSLPAIFFLFYCFILFIFNATPSHMTWIWILGGSLIISMPVYFLLPVFLCQKVDKIHLIISNDKIELYRRNFLVFQRLWSEIETIELIKEKYHAQGGVRLTGYKLKFIKSNQSEELRLWAFSIHKKNRRLFLRKIKEITAHSGKKFVEKEETEKLKKGAFFKIKSNLRMKYF